MNNLLGSTYSEIPLPVAVMALNSYNWDYNDIYIYIFKNLVIGVLIPVITVKGHNRRFG